MMATRTGEIRTGDTAFAEWSVWSTTARLVVTNPRSLPAARTLVCEHLIAVDRACSRFRADSEISRLAAHGGGSFPVSELCAEYLRAALTVAAQTDGDVDPTVGAALVELGYDRDWELIAGSDTGASVPLTITRRADWTQVMLDERIVTMPAGFQLDLGATAKAVAADRCARLVTERLGCGVLVSLGGDIATAGPAPVSGWQILVQDDPGEPACQVRLPAGAALATSSTLRRRWWRGGLAVHHIVDPRTGAAAETCWRTVTVAAETCLTANAASTASIVRGRDALGKLRRSGLPARLVDRTGRVVTVGAWPTEPEGRSI